MVRLSSRNNEVEAEDDTCIPRSPRAALPAANTCRGVARPARMLAWRSQAPHACDAASDRRAGELGCCVWCGVVWWWTGVAPGPA